jgi:sec-independent protein translocase protein TatA
MNITFWEVLLVVLVIVLLFGGKKIPELMKGLGKGVKSFKEGMRETEEEIKSIDTPEKTESKKDDQAKNE